MLAAGGSLATMVCSARQNSWEALGQVAAASHGWGWAKQVRSWHSMGQGMTLSCDPSTLLKPLLPGGSRSCDSRFPTLPHNQAEKQLCKSGNPFQSRLYCSHSPGMPNPAAMLREVLGHLSLQLSSQLLLGQKVGPCPRQDTVPPTSVPLWGWARLLGTRRGWDQASPSPAWWQHRDSRSLPCRAKNRLQLRSWR